jgi:hypothetical protein
MPPCRASAALGEEAASSNPSLYCRPAKQFTAIATGQIYARIGGSLSKASYGLSSIWIFLRPLFYLKLLTPSYLQTNH